MRVINFYGGAGIGKSTIAADIFSKLKRKGHKTELVGEYAKWLWYQNDNNTPDELFDQLVMHEHAKFDNVDYLLRRNDEFISIDGRKETNLERAKVKDEVGKRNKVFAWGAKFKDRLKYDSKGKMDSLITS